MGKSNFAPHPINFVGPVVMSRTTPLPEFCIVANNCWGAEVYKHFERPYNTPVVGLFFFPDDYLKFIKNLRVNLSSPLTFTNTSRHVSGQPKYPVGLVNGIEIHFLHYKTEQEATEKWNRRCARVPADDHMLYFKFDDRDGATDQHIIEFHRLGLPNSISFTKTRFAEFASNVHIPMPSSETSVMDGFAQYYEGVKHFDLEHWVRTGQVRRSWTHRINTAFRRLKTILKA